jgi:glycosidase
MRLTALLFLISLTGYAQIERVEPSFWYAGMRNRDVQILFYGKNIAENDISVSNKIVIKEIKRTENPNYLFVTIDTKDIKAQEFEFSFLKNKQVAFTKKYSLRRRRENSAQRKSYDASDMIYLIMPDRFANGDTNNDSDKSVIERPNRNLAGGRHGGDIKGIIQHLDYLKELGVTTVWPTPLCEDNDSTRSYHGYAQSDVYKIDPRFGTNEEYVKLSDELHKRDMKLIMDYVTNHWGSEHWMMKDLPTKEWMHPYVKTNGKQTTQFDQNASKIDSKMFVDGWFTKTMPDLNQSNLLVLNYLIQNAIWWIEYADLDGFRVDTYPYNDKEGIAKWTKAITDEFPNFNIVGETWVHNQAQLAFWQKESKIAAIENYNSYLPSVMDFTLLDALGTAFNENPDINKIYENFINDFLYPNINNIMDFAENHDTKRFNEIYKGDFRKYQMVMSLLATIRGIPQLYYGSEIGLGGNKGKGDDDRRQDFPGGWKSDTNNAFTKSGRTEVQEKFFEFTSRLFQWRKTNEAVHFGKTTHYFPENNVYVYFRYTDKKTVMVVINNGTGVQTLKTNRFQENIKDFKSGKEIITGKTIDFKSDIVIESQSVMIIEFE